MLSLEQLEEKKKDEILQVINDILEKYDWGGYCKKKMIIKITLRGKFYMTDPEVIIREDGDLTSNKNVI